jgi:hypothetical protein
VPRQDVQREAPRDREAQRREHREPRDRAKAVVAGQARERGVRMPRASDTRALGSGAEGHDVHDDRRSDIERQPRASDEASRQTAPAQQHENGNGDHNEDGDAREEIVLARPALLRRPEREQGRCPQQR